jgi:hypothetical protein
MAPEAGGAGAEAMIGVVLSPQPAPAFPEDRERKVEKKQCQNSLLSKYDLITKNPLGGFICK